MNARFLGLAVLLFAAAATLHAFDPSGFGLRVVEESRLENNLLFMVRDRAGRQFSVVSPGAVAESRWRVVADLHDTFYAWPGLEVEALRFYLREDGIDATVDPAALRYEGRELSAYMPSGIGFYYSQALYYDFRLKKGNLFLRVSGRWIGPDEFGARVADALARPDVYLQSQSPEQIAARLTEHDRLLADLAVGAAETSLEVGRTERELAALGGRHEVLAGLQDGLAADLEALGDDHSALAVRHADLRRDYRELAGRHADLLAAHRELEARHERLLEEHRASREDLERLRVGVLALNRRRLRRAIPLDPQTLDAVLDARAGHPLAGAQELQREIKGRGVAASRREIRLILAVYLGQF
jgi:hypothetical protein